MAARPERQGAAVPGCAILVAASAARSTATRAALLGSVWLGALAILAPNIAHAVDGTWTGPGAEWTVGTNWTSIPPNTVPDNTATFANNGPTSVTISNSTSINTIEFSAGAPAYSFTVQNGATFAINSGIINNPSLEPAFTVNAGAALTVGNGAFAEIGSLAGGGTVTIGPSSSSSLLSIVGDSSITFSGTFAGRGSLELDNTASLTLTGASNGGNIGTIGGDLTLCSSCSGPALTISGGSLTVGHSTIVEGGTLTVTNGGTLTTTNFGVAGSAVITGAGSSVTVTGQTIIGNFAPASLTISDGGVLNSQGGADIATGLPFLGTPTVTVNAGGRLGGTGTLGNTIISGGTLSPGNSIGTLTVSGNLTMTAAASYLVEISPTNADRTNVAGTATLAGTVQAAFAAGSYVTRNYTILSAAGGRSGTFSALTTANLPAGFSASLSY